MNLYHNESSESVNMKDPGNVFLNRAFSSTSSLFAFRRVKYSVTLLVILKTVPVILPVEFKNVAR